MKLRVVLVIILGLASTVLGFGQITETKVEQGKVAGFEQNGMGYFKAIPYAEAPTG